MKVKYLKKGEYQGNKLTIGKIYIVLAIENDYYRILDDSDEPYLYNPKQFEVVDASKPNFWVKNIDEDNEASFGPFSWLNQCFFEKYHDGNKKVISRFWSDCERLYGISRNV